MPSSMSPTEIEALPQLKPDVALTLLARRLPKAEMHMHQMGSLAPSEMARLHKLKHGRRVPDEDTGPAYDLLGTGKFFDDLDRAVALWGDTALVTAGVLHMISAAFDRGVRHLELLCTPDLHRQQVGMESDVLLRAIGEAFAVAHDELGLTGGIVVEMHRFDGPEAAVQLVKETVGLRERGVPILGYGNDGDHRTVRFSDLAPAYSIARAEGFNLTGHADVFEDVEDAVELGLDRIDHGWQVAQDETLCAHLAESGTTLTFTPTTYALAMDGPGRESLDAYVTLRSAGIPIAIGTDDPELFHTDLSQEYAFLARALGWSAHDLAEAAKQSFRSAWFFDAKLKEELLTTWFREIDALVDDARGLARPGAV